MTMDQFYKKYDTDKSSMISAMELKKALSELIDLDMDNKEVKMLSEYMKKKGGRSELKKDDFNKLLKGLPKGNSNSLKAKKSMKKLAKTLEGLNIKSDGQAS